MAFCTKCGSQVTDDAAFCQTCGAGRRGITAPAIVAGSAARTSPVRQGVVMPPALPPRAILMVSQKSSGLAAVMSFFWSGLGQIYTGQIGKGILMMILYPILVWTGLGTISAGGLVARLEARMQMTQPLGEASPFSAF
jgi:zinc ribbon protein